ncbi:rRNA-processing protein FYV7 [Candida viswanathii]|uniref:rRNA-processing protein FYV7 n=1 Tax=Candida viswanathii TaxID=5486 RepID=A0A367YJ00_9ASCO|nr:rRNA-processing protein FYV7 [Candida viswanathii]
MPANKPYNKKKFVDRREAKSQDIKRALTHRARLRKNYFKLLEKEGLQESRKPEDDEADNEEQGEEKLKPKPKPKKKGINFEERAKIVKQRKEEKRKQKLERVQEKLNRIETKSKERALRKEQLKKTTTKGQPLMGPRINNLLDKIKKDIGN